MAETPRREQLKELLEKAQAVDAAYGDDLDLSAIIQKIQDKFDPHVVTGIVMSFPLTEGSGLTDAQAFAQKELAGIELLKNNGAQVVSMIVNAINGSPQSQVFNGTDANDNPITVKFTVVPTRNNPLG